MKYLLIVFLLVPLSVFGQHVDPKDEIEHQAIENLIKPEKVTIKAVRSGNWSSVLTWSPRRLPNANDIVLIPKGITVKINTSLTVKKIKYEGILDHAINKALTIRLDTIVGSKDSLFRLISVDPSKVVRYKFLAGPIDLTDDPLVFGRGWITHGSVEVITIAGVIEWEKALAWKPGDQKLVPTIEQNLFFESESTIPSEFAHIMFMHTNDVLFVGGVGDKIGRTDKNKLVTDPIPGKPETYLNPRGRYFLHFHKGGGSFHDDEPAFVYGVTSLNSPGWAFVNHSSFVNFEECESYNVVGGHFVTETGNEIGSFVNCLAAHSTGKSSPRGLADDRGRKDWAFDGTGFWIQGGGGVKLINNMELGNNKGIIFMGNDSGLFPVSNLDDPSIWLLTTEMMPAQDVPIYMYGNICKSPLAFSPWAIHNPHYHNTRSLIENNRFEGTVSLGYSSAMHFLECISRGNNYTGSAYTNTGSSITNEKYEHLDIEGFEIGLHNPITEGDGEIIGGRFKNIANIVILNTQQGWERNLYIDDTQLYEDVPADILAKNKWPRWWLAAGQPQWDIYCGIWFFSWNIAGLEGWPYYGVPSEATWLMLFDSPNIVVSHKDNIIVGDEFLSFEEFGPTYSLGILKNLPADLRLKADGTPRTTEELAKDKTLFMGGKQLPLGAYQVPGIRGWLHKDPPIFK